MYLGIIPWIDNTSSHFESLLSSSAFTQRTEKVQLNREVYVRTVDSNTIFQYSWSHILKHNKLDILHLFLKHCSKRKLIPTLYVDHEVIEPIGELNNRHQCPSIPNSFHIIDNLCKQLLIEHVIIVDAGVENLQSLTTKYGYSTKITHMCINKWASLAADICSWTNNHIWASTDGSKPHILSDLTYPKYPVMSFLSRPRASRTLFFHRAKQLGLTDNNPYLTFNDTSVVSVSDIAGETLPIDQNDILRKPDTEFLYNKETNVFDTDFMCPSIRTFQNIFVTLSLESVTRDTGTIFLTEKTFFSWLNFKPVVVLGQRGVNKFLETIGFDMFKDLIDYDKFDDLETIEERSVQFANTVAYELVQNFEEKLSRARESQLEFDKRLKNNYNLFMKLYNYPQNRHPWELIDIKRGKL